MNNTSFFSGVKTVRKPVQNTLNVALNKKEINTKHDTGFKSIFQYKIVAAMMLKALVKEYQPYSIDTILTWFDKDHVMPEVVSLIELADTEMSEPDEKVTRFDLLFDMYPDFYNKDSCKYDPKTSITINVEHQGHYNIDYNLASRGLFYAARLPGSQLKPRLNLDSREGNNTLEYKNLHKVISVWFYLGKKSDTSPISRYKFCKEKELLAEPCYSPEYSSDLIEIIICNVNALNDGFLESLDLTSNKSKDSIPEILKALQILFNEPENFLQVVSEITDYNLEGEIDMKELSEYDKTMMKEQARRDGLEVGREEGKEEGKEESAIVAAVSLLEDGLKVKRVVQYLLKLKLCNLENVQYIINKASDRITPSTEVSQQSEE